VTAQPEPAGATAEPRTPASEVPSKLSDRRKRPAKRPAVTPDTAREGFTIITGLSGAGRSEAARCLEDLGYFVVDNLPPALLPKMAELGSRPGGPGRVAIRHPLAPADRVVEGIRKERTMMEALRGDADLIIDTSGLTPHELRDRIRDAFSDAPPEESLQVSLVSFGYKYGAPRDADLVIDCRFLPNPHWVEDLRPLPGTDDRVRTFVRGQATYREFLRRLRALLGFMVPGFVAEGKSYLTVAIGCTGGRHRSVVVVEDLASFFRNKGLPASVDHRDLDR
jgi:RNase adapter protein RapZ